MKKIITALFMALNFLNASAQNVQISPEMKLAFLQVHQNIMDYEKANIVEGKDLQAKIDKLTSNDKSLYPYKEYLSFSYNGLYYDKFADIMPQMIKYNGAQCLLLSNMISKTQYNPNIMNESLIVDDVYDNIIVNAMSHIADAGNNGIKRPQYVCIPVSIMIKSPSDYFAKTYEIFYLSSRMDAKKLEAMTITSKEFKKKLKIFMAKNDGSLKRIQ